MFEYVLFSIPKIGIQAGVIFSGNLSPSPLIPSQISCWAAETAIFHCYIPSVCWWKHPFFINYIPDFRQWNSKKKKFVDYFSHENLHL